YFRLLELFLVQITKDKSMGKIIAESDPSQDKQLINAHVSHQTQNLIYRQKITSISLVTKSNQDADVQIADALAPIVNIYLSKKTKNRIEQIKIRLIDRKLKDQNNPSYLEQLL
ncbi:MAG TPA: hypothetical protein VJ242_00060, partial [Patescibacteria group bacterium]|nr:hypothetical protein [Patescibacteria group bacterium]